MMVMSFMEHYRNSINNKSSLNIKDDNDWSNILYKDAEYISHSLFMAECAVELRDCLYSEADINTILTKIKEYIINAVKAIWKIIMKIVAYVQTNTKEDLRKDVYEHANKSTTVYKRKKMGNKIKDQEKKLLSLYGQAKAQFPNISTDALEIVDAQIFRMVIEKVSYNLLTNIKDILNIRSSDEWKKKTDDAAKVIEKIMDDIDITIKSQTSTKDTTYNDNLMKLIGSLQGVFSMLVGIISQINKDVISKAFTGFVFEFLPEGVELDRVGTELFMKVTSIAYSINTNFDQNQVYSILNTDKNKVPEINEMMQHVIDIYIKDLTEKNSSMISYIENKLKDQEFNHVPSSDFNIFGIRAVCYNAMNYIDEEIDIISELLKRLASVDLSDRSAMYNQYGDIMRILKSSDSKVNPLYEIIKPFNPILKYEDYVMSLNLDFKFDTFINRKELTLANNSKEMVHLIHDTMLKIIK